MFVAHILLPLRTLQCFKGPLLFKISMDCKNTIGETRCLLHAKVHLPLRTLQCFKGLDMGSAVQDNYRKYPIVTVPYIHFRCIATVLVAAIVKCTNSL